MSEELQTLIDKSKENFNKFKLLTFKKLTFYDRAMFDTDKEGMKFYDEPREEEEEIEFDNYGLSDEEVKLVITHLCQNGCPTIGEIQKALKDLAESNFVKDPI